MERAMSNARANGEGVFARMVFRDALEAGGCLVCRAVADMDQRSIYSFLYEGIEAPSVLARFLAGGGFCPRHFRQVAELGVNRWSVGCVETAILCRHMLPRATREAAELGRSRETIRLLSAGGGGADTPLFPGRDCMFCKESAEQEARFVALLETATEDEALSSAIANGGLCLPHGYAALKHWRGRRRVEWLRAQIEAQSERLAKDLQEYLRKYDERFRREPFGGEIDVVERAVGFLAGTKSNGLKQAAVRHTRGRRGTTMAEKP